METMILLVTMKSTTKMMILITLIKVKGFADDGIGDDEHKDKSSSLQTSCFQQKKTKKTIKTKKNSVVSVTMMKMKCCESSSIIINK